MDVVQPFSLDPEPAASDAAVSPKKMQSTEDSLPASPAAVLSPAKKIPRAAAPAARAHSAEMAGGEAGCGVVGAEGDDVVSDGEDEEDAPAYVPSPVVDARGALPGAVNESSRRGR